MGSLQAFVSALPKVELHVHLVGSAPVETVLSLARRHPEGGVPTSEEALREFYEFRDFPHFIDVYQAVSRLITEPEDISELVRGVAANLAAQHVRYAEFQFGPYAFQRTGMPDAVITEALDIGARSALAEYGVRAGGSSSFPGRTRATTRGPRCGSRWKIRRRRSSGSVSAGSRPGGRPTPA